MFVESVLDRSYIMRSDAFGRLGVWVFLAAAFLCWGVVFPFVSRRMEMEADLCAVELSGSTEVFVNALERISHFSGRPRSANSWRHFSIERRVDFLTECAQNPERAASFKIQLSLIRWGIILLAVCSIVAAVLVSI